LRGYTTASFPEFRNNDAAKFLMVPDIDHNIKHEVSIVRQVTEIRNVRMDFEGEGLGERIRDSHDDVCYGVRGPSND
jgi:hypothetical protein